MKKILLIVFILGLVQCVFGQEEFIKNFHVDLKIDTTGLLVVTENIEVVATGDQIKRGIVRSLPLQGVDYQFKKVRNDYQILHVRRDGSPEPYHTQKQDGDLYIYIGDENVFLDPGTYTFSISYSAMGQLGYFDSYDELYWNVNGFNWNLRIEKISASLSIPKAAQFENHFCYTGLAGSKDTNCEGNLQADGSFYFTAENLPANQNLTVAAAFTKGIVSPPPPPTFWQKFGFMVITLVTVFILILYYVITWWKFGKDDPMPTVIPEFEPPAGISPASLGMINSGNFSNDLISASIVNLAVNGYLKIEEKIKSGIFKFLDTPYFTLSKLKDADDSLPGEEKMLMQGLFAFSNEIDISRKYNPHMKSVVDGYSTNLLNQNQKILNQGNNTLFWIPPVLLFFLYFWLTSDMELDSTVEFSLGLEGILPFLVPSLIISMILLSFLKKKINTFVFYGIINILVIILLVFLFRENVISLNIFLMIAFILFFLISFFSYVFLIKKPSVEKLELQAQIAGFKKYMSAAEERQLQMFNPPQMTPEIFERLLPFAMVLSVDKIWGKKLQDLVDAGNINQQHNSGWYTGSRSYSYYSLGRHINQNLGKSMNQSAGTSGGSGSGGGGSSGGGRGGGGGGGW
jgi:uncharacterized membrane protein